MKKRLFIIGLALLFPLTACGAKNATPKKEEEIPAQEAEEPTVEPEEEKGEEDPGEAKREKANELIYTFVLDHFGEAAADDSKETIEAYCADPAFDEIDVSRISTYLTLYSLIDNKNPQEIIGFLNALAHDEVFEDAIYFALIVAKASLHAAGYNDPEQKEVYDKLIVELDKQGQDLENNLVAVIEKLSYAYTELMTEAILYSSLDIIDFETGLINVESLKRLLNKIAPVFKDILKIRDNVQYFADLAVVVGFDLLIDDKFIPFGADLVLKFVNTKVVIDAIFDFGENFVDSLPVISDEYYDELASIEDPTESYVYAVIGLICEAADIASLSQNQLKEAVHAVFYVISLIQKLSDDLIELPEFVDSLLENEFIEDTLVFLLGLVYKTFGCQVDEEKIMELVNYIAELIKGNESETEEPADDVFNSLDELPEEIKELLPIEEIEQSIAESASKTWEDDIHVLSEISYDSEKNAYSYASTRIEYYIDVIEGDPNVYVAKSVAEVVFPSLQPVADSIYDGLNTIVEHLDEVDAAIDEVVKAYNSVCEFIPSLEKYLAEEEYAKVQEAMDLVASYVTEENIALCKKAIRDVAVCVRDVFSAFIPNEEGAVDIDFTILIINLINGTFVKEDYFNKIQSSKLMSSGDVFIDIYEIAELIGKKEELLAWLDEVSQMTISPYVDSAENFGGLLLFGIIGYLGY